MDVTKVLDKAEKKLFKKQNANFSAKIYFRLIEDTLESDLDSLEKQKIIEIYISQLDKIYDNSIREKKGNLLKTSAIEKYSVLKYFMKIKKDFLIDFVADELLNDYSKKLDETFEIQEINVQNVLTEEKMELNRKMKKMLLKLLSNLIKSGQLETNYSLMVETTKDTECVVANPENEVVKTKKQ